MSVRNYTKIHLIGVAGLFEAEVYADRGTSWVGCDSYR